MIDVVSAQLVAVGAAWDGGPGAGAWIAARLGPFGGSVGHAAPLGYAGYAVVPTPWEDDESPSVVDAPLDVTTTSGPDRCARRRPSAIRPMTRRR